MEMNANALPGLDCGLCGFRRCEDFAVRLKDHPDWIDRCVHLSGAAASRKTPAASSCFATCGTACGASCEKTPSDPFALEGESAWQDSLGREIDFYLEHFPEEPGPREIILPHNPMLTRELNIKPGDVLLGRPLGMSCGCPITHCGVAMTVDQRTGVMSWCVTGPLKAREEGYLDIGYYIAEGYEGLVRESRVDIRIGMRYFFQPRMCMLQWRHSGLCNFINQTDEGLQIRLEGLWIG